MGGLRYGGARASARLQGHAGETVGAGIIADLVDLATEAENNRGGNIRMIEHPGQRSLQLQSISGPIEMAASLAVREGDNAIHVLGQRLILEAGRDQIGSMRGAVAGSDDGDVIASPCPSIGTRIAEKRRSVSGTARQAVCRWWEIRNERRELFEGDVMGMEMVAGLDGTFWRVQCGDRIE